MDTENEAGNTGVKRKQQTSVKPRKKAKVDLDCDKLIQLIQGHSCIWNNSCSSYKDNSKKTRAWNIILLEMQAPVPDLKSKWKSLGDHFRRLLDSAWNGRSGNGLDEEKIEAISWKYFKSMQFFKDSYVRRKTVTNFDEEDETSMSLEDPTEPTSEEVEQEFQEYLAQLDRGNDKENDNDSVLLSPRSNSAAGPSTPLARPVKKASLPSRNGQAESVLQQLAKNAESMSKMITEPADPCEKFLGYLGEQLTLVPSDTKKKCEQAILSLVNWDVWDFKNCGPGWILGILTDKGFS